MTTAFSHRQSAHCETGVAANLLNHYGITIDESLAFGIGSGLFFGYLPFIRVNHLPLTTFRIATGGIMKRLTRRLGVRLHIETFRRADRAMDALDDLIASGIPVGCQTGGYWLPYFPEAYRFHFNMHNLLVIGKDGDDYLISDPIFEFPVTCSRSALIKARFAKGALAPKGKMYYVKQLPDTMDMDDAVKKGVSEICDTMLKAPFPLIGVKGIRHLANQVERWPKKLGPEKTLLYLGQLIRMQEEIGTGGAGFRFIFAAFLQKAAHITGNPDYFTYSETVTRIGDRWRDFAAAAARHCKGRPKPEDTFAGMADMIRACADDETRLYRALLTIRA